MPSTWSACLWLTKTAGKGSRLCRGHADAPQPGHLPENALPSVHQYATAIRQSVTKRGCDQLHFRMDGLQPELSICRGVQKASDAAPTARAHQSAVRQSAAAAAAQLTGLLCSSCSQL